MGAKISEKIFILDLSMVKSTCALQLVAVCSTIGWQPSFSSSLNIHIAGLA
jgi:hypothetical protein